MQTAEQLNALLAAAEEAQSTAAELQVAAHRALAELPAQIDEATQGVRRETRRVVVIGTVSVLATALVIAVLIWGGLTWTTAGLRAEKQALRAELEAYKAARNEILAQTGGLQVTTLPGTGRILVFPTYYRLLKLADGRRAFVLEQIP
ncbi:MAG: hypothetical protein LUG19_06075 [Desulfovibrio sp.]|uniref:hypothetical protein n=1 Tax=Desulfovibrio sp. TaxID=885 RepID=UPI002588E700|nr:hypothetical protein [Desulfovibrio sp.]MCD7983808.1 hypothetical protein [Desulfovibrio sp.]